MSQKINNSYIKILKYELVPALGCTEPGAIAYAAAKAVSVLEEFPIKIEIKCSGNIVKNVKGVVVPNSGGLRGIEAATILGAIAGTLDTKHILGNDSENKLEILDAITETDRIKAKELLSTDFCKCRLQEGESNLYIDVIAKTEEHSARVVVKDSHTNIILIKKDDKTIFEKEGLEKNIDIEETKKLLNVKDIIAFADTVNIEEVKPILDYQIYVNTAIAEEGLKNEYGASVGKTLLESYGDDIKVRAKAKAAAGSDARMGGSSMPVVINSGSGNQGITVTVPVVEYAKELGVDDDKMYRALVISNLISIHIKQYIGKLSAFCGAVSAACGSGAAITYLHGGTFEDISSTIINTVCNVGGIVCDGAKASCAAKIASALDAAIMGHNMTLQKRKFQEGEGIVTGDIEKTIQNIGHIGREGMKETDNEILHLMIGDIN
ncbi:MAG: serine dehydratase subunit alpha family protein [Aminipila sp.]